MKEKLYTASQAAAIAGVTESYMRKLLRAKIVRGEKLGPRAWMVPQSEVARAAEYKHGQRGRPRSRRAD